MALSNQKSITLRTPPGAIRRAKPALNRVKWLLRIDPRDRAVYHICCNAANAR